MPYDGTGWDISHPAVGDLISNGCSEITDLRKGVALRVNKEHDTLATSSAGGEHKAGSAKIYTPANVTALASVLRPDGVTSLAAGDKGRFAVAEDTKYLYYYNGSAWVQVGMVNNDYVLLQEIRADSYTYSGVTAGTWNLRTFTHETVDTGSICGITVPSSGFTLPAGTYRVRASAVGYRCEEHQIRLYDNSSGAVIAYGMAGYSVNSTDSASSIVHLEARFTLPGTKTLQLQHWVDTVGVPANVFGLKSGSGTDMNIYCQISFHKEF
jgi:hypothetical protein